MIKLVNLFEDIKVEPRFTLIFKIPFYQELYEGGYEPPEINFSKAVEMKHEAVLSELTGYRDSGRLDIYENDFEDTDGDDSFVEARYIFVDPRPGILEDPFPEGFEYEILTVRVSGFVYLATRGRFLKPSALEGIYGDKIDFYTRDESISPQSALDYLLFK